MVVRRLRGASDERLELVIAADDLHRATAEDIRGANDHRIADLRRDRARLLDRSRLAVRGRRDVELREELRELPAILREIDRLGTGPEHRVALLLQRVGQLEGRLPSELHDDADGALHLTDGQAVL